MIQKIKTFAQKHRVEFVLISIIILSASFLRLYKIADYMTFLGDEGRDAIVAKEILHGNLTLLGPRASAGDFFLGPIYYYMIAPFLFLANYDPVGPAVMVALFGIATVFLVYYIGKKLFDAKAGLVAASLYAVSPIVIAYSRSSWNPNLMPIASILIIYCIYLGVKNGSIKLLWITGVLLGIAMQLHYLTVFLGVIIFFFILIGNILVSKKEIVSKILKQYIAAFIGFILGWSPFLAFEIRHGFPNIRTIFSFVFEENAQNEYLPHQSFFGQIGNVFFRLFGRLVLNFPDPARVNINIDPILWVWFYSSIILALVSVLFLFKTKSKLKILLVSLYLFFGVFLFGVYKKPIYDYYLGFMFPLPFLLVGNLFSRLQDYKKYKKIISVTVLIVVAGLLFLNLSGNPFRYTPNRQKEQARNIAEFVLSKTEGKPFNFALLTKGNSDHVYRYFFEINDKAPVAILNTNIDPERTSVTDQLMIICEEADCQPLGNPLWEVAGFGQAEIVGEWRILHLKIFKLVHYNKN